MNRFYQHSAIAAFAIALSLSAPVQAIAGMIRIAETPQDNDGPFIHNVFHSSRNGGPSGSILAWFDLDKTQTNTMNPMTGAFNATFNIFTNASLTTKIGSVVASSNTLDFGELSDGDQSRTNVGAIRFAFNGMSAGDTLYDHLGGNVTIDLSFIDRIYVDRGANRPNSWDPARNALTLWGSSSSYSVGGETRYLGVDMVAIGAPVPPSLILMGIGLGGLGLNYWRRKNCLRNNSVA